MRITAPVSLSEPDLEARAVLARRVRRAFSLSGVVPLGAFLVLHGILNAQALKGAAAFTAVVETTHRVPALPLVEALFVFAPLAFHAALGLWFVVTRTPLAPPAPYPPPLRIAMRATGVVALAFLLMHLVEVRFHSCGARLRGDELATLLDAELSSLAHGVPWRGLAYLFAAACVTFHFVCGLWGFFATSRSGRERARWRRWAAWGAVAGGLAMWVAFADVVVLRATGARLFGAEAQEPASPASCPGPER